MKEILMLKLTNSNYACKLGFYFLKLNIKSNY